MTTQNNQALTAVIEAAADIESDRFTIHQDVYADEISSALIDAVFSIQARYEGVAARLERFRARYPHACDDLTALIDLGESEIAGIMGNAKTAGRHKSRCVIDAATAFVNLPEAITTARAAREAHLDDGALLSRTYRSVHGLGWITAEYFLMQLGIPGVKADIMVVRFVNDALHRHGLPPVDDKTARQLVVSAFEHDSRGAATLSAFDHAIWLTQRVKRDSRPVVS